MFQELQHGFDSTEMLPKSGDGPTMTFSPVKTSTDLDLRSSLGTADIILEAETLPGRPAGLGGGCICIHTLRSPAWSETL